MNNYEQQSILVDQEFCDQNIFTYYQRSNKVQPKIIISDEHQRKNVRTQLNVNVNHSIFQFSMNIISNSYEPKIFQSASLPKKNFNMKTKSSRQQKNLQSLSTDTAQFEQQKPKLRSFIGILIKNKLSQNYKRKNTQIQYCDKKINLKKDCYINYTEQQPQSFRYKDLQLNSFMEEYKLIKQQTIATVILPNINQYQNKNDHSRIINSSRLSIQQYQHHILPNKKNKSKSLNKQNLQKNFNLSGWSDHSDK